MTGKEVALSILLTLSLIGNVGLLLRLADVRQENRYLSHSKEMDKKKHLAEYQALRVAYKSCGERLIEQERTTSEVRYRLDRCIDDRKVFSDVIVGETNQLCVDALEAMLSLKRVLGR